MSTYYMDDLDQYVCVGDVVDCGTCRVRICYDLDTPMQGVNGEAYTLELDYRHVWTDAAGAFLTTWDLADAIGGVYGIDTVADVLKIAGCYFEAVNNALDAA